MRSRMWRGVSAIALVGSMIAGLAGAQGTGETKTCSIPTFTCGNTVMGAISIECPANKCCVAVAHGCLLGIIPVYGSVACVDCGGGGGPMGL